MMRKRTAGAGCTTHIPRAPVVTRLLSGAATQNLRQPGLPAVLYGKEQNDGGRSIPRERRHLHIHQFDVGLSFPYRQRGHLQLEWAL